MAKLSKLYLSFPKQPRHSWVWQCKILVFNCQTDVTSLCRSFLSSFRVILVFFFRVWVSFLVSFMVKVSFLVRQRVSICDFVMKLVYKMTSCQFDSRKQVLTQLWLRVECPRTNTHLLNKMFVFLIGWFEQFLWFYWLASNAKISCGPGPLRDLPSQHVLACVVLVYKCGRLTQSLIFSYLCRV